VVSRCGRYLFDSPERSTSAELAAALQLSLIEYDKGGFSERQLRSYVKQAVQEIARTEKTSVTP